jgi:thiamine-phosphate pyrophosphorylase
VRQTPQALAARLRLIVITDRGLAEPRSVVDIVRAAVATGAPAIQLRDKEVSARGLAEAGRELLAITRPAGALLFVNDRLDVALAIGADGVHLGPDDIPVAAAREAVGAGGSRGVDLGAEGGAGAVVAGSAGDEGGGGGAGGRGNGGERRFLIGTSTDDPGEARALVSAGADYIGCGTVYATSSKANAGEVIGLERLQAVVAAVDVPVLGIGGVTPERAADIRAGTGAAGVAVIRAVMGADDVGGVVRGLLGPWEARPVTT